MLEHRKDVLKNNPHLKARDVLRHCAEDWKNVDAQVKEKYINDYKEEVKAYSSRILEFRAKLSDDQKDVIDLVSNEKRKDKIKRAKRKVMFVCV